MEKKDWQVIYQYALAAIIIVCFMVLLILVVDKQILQPPSAGTGAAPATKGDANTAIISLLTTLLGSFGAMTTMVVSYFFGSSKGSADKNDMIYNSTPTPPAK